MNQDLSLKIKRQKKINNRNVTINDQVMKNQRAKYFDVQSQESEALTMNKENTEASLCH